MSTRISIPVAAALLAGIISGIPLGVHAEPTHKDVRYSKKYDRSVLDIWTVDAKKPAPLVVNFHGGGFKMGDKSHFHRNPLLKRYHAKGVAFATVNYPFLKHTNDSYPAIIGHTEDAIRFLQANAKKYNIDPQRISVMGASAGALISCYLGHGTDTAIRSVFANAQPMGTNILTLPTIHKGGPPIILYTRSGPGDRVHHPDNAKKVHARCKKLGVYSEVYGSKQSGLPTLPEGQDIHELVMKFFYKSWQLPFPG